MQVAVQIGYIVFQLSCLPPPNPPSLSLPLLFRVNNCVGYSNYKFFVLFLFYTMLLCVWFAATGGYDFFRAWVS